MPANLQAAKVIKEFSEDRRNTIRGIVSDTRRGKLDSERIDAVRRNNSESDMAAAAAMLEAPGALRKRKIDNLQQSHILFSHNLTAQSPVLEAAYACGFLNAWKADALIAVETITVLSDLTLVPLNDAIGALKKTSEKWGASNYLALKISYLKEFLEPNIEDDQYLGEIDRILGHKVDPHLQYSALEVLMPRISIFSVARRHTNTLMEHINGDYRRFYSLNNLVATPFDEADCAGFFLRAVESSLIDAVRALWVIICLADRFPAVFAAVQRNLDADIFAFIKKSQTQLADRSPPIHPEGAIVDLGDGGGAVRLGEEPSLALYRQSIAFLEFPSLCRYRHDIDQVIGHRLMVPVIGGDPSWSGPSFQELETLNRENGNFELSQHNTGAVELDTFYRTYLFLRFIQDPENLARLNSEDVQYLFDNTLRLDTLLLESELKTMHLNASDEARPMISVLAMALYRSKSSDPDVDFDFRSQLEEHVIRNFQGNIASFIDNLAPKSPQVANYIATSLDEVTLQKMYQIIDSPVAAENARREILTSVGVHLNKLEYIIEAEAIETRSKVAKLKSYFDASRMYVDSLAMKKWLGSNPSAYAQQYKELLPKLTARLSGSRNIVSPEGKEAKIDIFELTSTDEILVERMATEAFREFCTSNEFGIESYLGRRIRHNTLQGVMTKSVDGVLLKPENNPIIAGTPFGSALQSWESGYKIYIERMRREFLQFRSDSRPNALFVAEIDPSDPTTKRNLQQLVQTLRVSGADMLDELIITFCWRQIAPQLDAASRQIRVKMTQDVSQNLDQALQRFNGPEELKVRAALQDALTMVFTQVASWFQVPQTGFVPASIPEICNIIDIEHGRGGATAVSGNSIDTKYFGISVHRLYDCLAVLLQNAFKHGRPGTEVGVVMSTHPVESTNLHVLEVAVQSVLPKDEAGRCVERVSEALTSSETGKDMVTEGYSGIKKVKFITRLNEGVSTVAYDVKDETIVVRFQLKVELADKEVDN